MVSAKVLLWISAIVSIVALVTVIIAVAVPAWHSVSVDASITRVITTSTYTGLWQTCSKEEVKEYSSFTCTDLTDDDALRAVKAMTLMGTLVCGAAVVCIFLKCLIFKDNWMLLVIIIVMCISAGIFMVIGAIVFATEVSTDASDLHSGFALTIIAASLIIAVAFVMVCTLCCVKEKVVVMNDKEDD